MAKSSAGIDMTSKDIKMVCLTQKGPQLLLTNHALLPLTPTTNIPKVASNITRFSLHDGSIKVRKVTVPVVPKEELDEVIAWALKDALKTPVEGHTLRYYPLGGAPNKQQSYLAIAVERKRIQEQLIELQKRGVSHPQWIEPSVQALANCVSYSYDLQPTDRVAVIHLDPFMTYCMVVSHEGLIFYRTFSRTHGGGTASELLTVEIQYSCENYLSQFENQPITNAILAGESADLAGVKKHIEETLQVPTVLLEPFKKIELTEQQKTDLTEQQTQYGVAVGLAL